MKLADWLSERKMTQAAFADLIGSSQPQVARFAAGRRIPNEFTMRKIMDVTCREVTANDFFDREPDEAAA